MYMYVQNRRKENGNILECCKAWTLNLIGSYVIAEVILFSSAISFGSLQLTDGREFLARPLTLSISECFLSFSAYVKNIRVRL